jgi:hypothetical protein
MGIRLQAWELRTHLGTVQNKVSVFFRLQWHRHSCLWVLKRLYSVVVP